MKIIIPNDETQLTNQTQQTIQTIAPNLVKTGAFKVLLPGTAKAFDVDKKFSEQLPETDASTNSFKSDPVLLNGNPITSYLGSQVFSNLNLTKKTNPEFQVLIDTALFNVTNTKNIVTTAIQGRNGTVKEYISGGDYKITIRGIISGYNGTYPQTQTANKFVSPVADLLEICQENTALTVNSWYLNQFDIYDIVVTDFTLGQNEGEFAVQTFEISALSDTPFQINIVQ